MPAISKTKLLEHVCHAIIVCKGEANWTRDIRPVLRDIDMDTTDFWAIWNLVKANKIMRVGPDTFAPVTRTRRAA